MYIGEFSTLNKSLQYIYKQFVESKNNPKFLIHIHSAFRPIHLSIFMLEIKMFFENTRINDGKGIALYGANKDDYVWKCSKGMIYLRIPKRDRVYFSRIGKNEVSLLPDNYISRYE